MAVFARINIPETRHDLLAPLVPYTNPVSNAVFPGGISYYDPDDYARDFADQLATAITGQGVTIYTIGLGGQLRTQPLVTITTRMELQRFHRQKLYSNILPNARVKVLML